MKEGSRKVLVLTLQDTKRSKFHAFIINNKVAINAVDIYKIAHRHFFLLPA